MAKCYNSKCENESLGHSMRCQEHEGKPVCAAPLCLDVSVKGTTMCDAHKGLEVLEEQRSRCADETCWRSRAQNSKFCHSHNPETQLREAREFLRTKLILASLAWLTTSFLIGTCVTLNERSAGRKGCEYKSIAAILSPGYILACELFRARFSFAKSE